jgi:drug/metabolite transporter (DMT)-like permease
VDKKKPVLAGVIVSVIFGLSFMFTKDALNTLAPLQLLGFRFAFAAIGLTLLRVAGIVRVDLRGKNPTALLLVGLFQPGIYFLCETVGVQLTSAAEAGMMMGLIPVVVVVLEVPFFKATPSPGQVAAILLSVTGVFFIILMKGNAGLGQNQWGTLALLGAVLAAGMYNCLSKKSTLDFTPVEITYIMMWTGALLFLFLAVTGHVAAGTVTQMFLPLAQARVLGAVLYLGLLSSVVAFFLMNYMLSCLRASQTATFINLTTVIAVLGGVIFLGEAYAWYQAVGTIMIILGVWGTTRFGREKAADTGTYLGEQL